MDLVTYIRGLIKKAENGKTQTTDYSDVLEKIDEITAASNGLPEKPELSDPQPYERLEYDSPDDEEIESAARASLSEYERTALDSIESEMNALAKKYEADKQANAAAYENTLKKLTESYERAVQAANDDALKRGLARSSIAANTVSAIEAQRAAATAETAASYERADAELAEKLSSLEVQREKALADFNIGYTARLTTEINALRQQREKLKAEAIKYNNSLAEKENSEAVKRAETESDLYADALKAEKLERELEENLTAVEQDKRYREIYDVLREKLLTMNAIDAQNEIRNNNLYRSYLSDAYYYKLYDEFGR